MKSPKLLEPKGLTLRAWTVCENRKYNDLALLCLQPASKIARVTEFSANSFNKTPVYFFCTYTRSLLFSRHLHSSIETMNHIQILCFMTIQQSWKFSFFGFPGRRIPTSYHSLRELVSQWVMSALDNVWNYTTRRMTILSNPETW